MIAIGFLSDPASHEDRNHVSMPKVVNLDGLPLAQTPGRQCPKCGQPTLIRQEGCDSCNSCGYSRCG